MESQAEAWPSTSPPIETPSELHISTNVAAPDKRDRFIILESGYLDAHYNQLENDLKNGASTMSANLVFEKHDYEMHVAIDVAHGMDQSISPQTTRMAAVRIGADAEVRLLKSSLPQLVGFAGASLGAANFDVRSYRAAVGSDITEREHAKGTALAFVPELGARLGLSDSLNIQIALRDWVLAGSEPLSKLGGASLGAGLGIGF